MLEFAPRFADDERQRHGLAKQPEMLAKQGFQSIQRSLVFAILLEAANPLGTRCVLFEPGVGRGDDQQSAGIEAFVNAFQQLARAVQAVDQVGGENQVVAGVKRLEIAGVTLDEFNAVTHRRQPEISQTALAVGNQFAFVGQGVAQRALFGKLNAEADEAGGEIKAGHLLEMARQFEGGAPRGAAKIERPPRGAPGHRGDAVFGEGFREIAHAEVLVAVVEFGVFGKQAVRFVMRDGRRHRRLADDIAEPGMLEEMPAEGIARGVARLVTAGNPGTALDQVVAIIVGRRGEIVVDRMHGKTGEGVNRRFRPLPDIADHVEQRAMRKRIDRAGRSPVIEVDIDGCNGLFRQLRHAGQRQQAEPFVFSGQTVGQPGLARLPAAERPRFEAIGFDRPVPGHVDHLGHQTQAPVFAVLPESRMRSASKGFPGPPLVVPEAVVGIATRIDEIEKLAVRYQMAPRLKRRQRRRMIAVFVVPTVERVVESLAKAHLAGRHIDQAVGWCRTLRRARRPGRMRLHVIEAMLANEDR